MIKDRFSNIERYNINKYFNELIEWVNRGKKEEDLPDSIKIIQLEYVTKKLDLSKFENHQRYIDIHHILEGEECIGVQEVNKLDPSSEYNQDDDYQLFKGETREEIILRRGEFLVLFTDEAHVTGGSVGKSIAVKKIVYKIPI